MDTFMLSQETLELVDKIKERTVKPLIANYQANIEDKKMRYKSNLLLMAINQKITDECRTPCGQFKSQKKRPRPTQYLAT